MSPAPDREALDVSWDFAWWNTGSFEARGFCSHLQAGWAKAEHRAYVGLLERSGRRVLFDAGYAPRFHDCAAPWLASIYRWATPATIPPGRSVTERLAGLKVDQLLLSHWHADHTGGLLDIPEASVWRPVSRRPSWPAGRVHLRTASRRGSGAPHGFARGSLAFPFRAGWLLPRCLRGWLVGDGRSSRARPRPLRRLVPDPAGRPAGVGLALWRCGLG